MPHICYLQLSRAFAVGLTAAVSVLATGSSSLRAAPLIDAAGGDRAGTSLADLTAADDKFLAWNDPASAAQAVDLPPAEGPGVLASGEALTSAFGGENPVVPLPPALVAGIVGLCVVGGLALRRQQGAAKFF